MKIRKGKLGENGDEQTRMNMNIIMEIHRTHCPFYFFNSRTAVNTPVYIQLFTPSCPAILYTHLYIQPTAPFRKPRVIYLFTVRRPIKLS